MTGGSSPPRICITLPAYNAERTLAKTLADIPDGIADELILVDDHSPDETASVARELGMDVYVHPENRRYGGNQKSCYRRALDRGADIVVLLHADYQYDPKAVPLLIAPITAGHADMTFGSRFASSGDPLGGGMPLYRYVGNRLTTVVENGLLGTRFTEMHSGMRAFTRRCLLSLPLFGYSDDFVFDSQLLADAVTLGMRVVEVPIITRYTHESSSIAIGASVSYVLQSIAYVARQVRRRGRRGRHAFRDPLRRGPATQARVAPSPTGLGSVRGRFDQALDLAERYWWPGPRVLVCGTDDALVAETGIGRGHQVSLPADSVPDDTFDVVISLDPGDVEGVVASSERWLGDEGLLVFSLPPTGDRRSREMLAEISSGLGDRVRPVESIDVLPESSVRRAHAGHRLFALRADRGRN